MNAFNKLVLLLILGLFLLSSCNKEQVNYPVKTLFEGHSQKTALKVLAKNGAGTFEVININSGVAHDTHFSDSELSKAFSSIIFTTATAMEIQLEDQTIISGTYSINGENINMELDGTGISITAKGTRSSFYFEGQSYVSIESFFTTRYSGHYRSTESQLISDYSTSDTIAYMNYDIDFVE